MQENLLKRQCYVPAAKKIKKLQFDAASKMLTMCPLPCARVHLHTHTDTESGYVTLRSNAEFSI